MRAFATLVATLSLVSLPAVAADADAVVIPWGAWLSASVETLVTVMAALVGWAVRRVPGAWADGMRSEQVDALLYRAIGYGVNAVAGASREKELTVTIANDVLREAARYAVEHAPKLVAWAGGEAAIREKILARLVVEPKASLADLPQAAR